MALKFFDLDEMSGIERERRVEAVRFVRAETSGTGFDAALVHQFGLPGGLKVPIVITEI